jgi:hypothetical protein
LAIALGLLFLPSLAFLQLLKMEAAQHRLAAFHHEEQCKSAAVTPFVSTDICQVKEGVVMDTWIRAVHGPKSYHLVIKVNPYYEPQDIILAGQDAAGLWAALHSNDPIRVGLYEKRVVWIQFGGVLAQTVYHPQVIAAAETEQATWLCLLAFVNLLLLLIPVQKSDVSAKATVITA